jgi:predicted nucleotidyltransferase
MAQSAYDPRRDAVVQEFLARVRAELGKEPVETLLFGSRARGDHDPLSDYDLIMVYDEVTPAMEETIAEIESQTGVERGVVICYHLVSVPDLDALTCEPFVINACREGVYLP